MQPYSVLLPGGQSVRVEAVTPPLQGYLITVRFDGSSRPYLHHAPTLPQAIIDLATMAAITSAFVGAVHASR